VSPWVSGAITLAFLGLGAIVVPWVGMRMLVPTLESAHAAAVTNYRGRRVVYGLGLVWVLWVIGVQFTALLLELVSFRAWSAWSFPPSGAGITDLAAPVLVLGAFALGFADDVFGTSADRGFRGHIAAFRHGRLTTGGLKLLGIGLLAAAVTLPGAIIAPVETPALSVAGEWFLATLAVALSANFVNLTDLRPGRALKVYSAAVVLLVVLPAVWYGYTGSLFALILLLGPVAAVWRYDLGERAMLGDAGANAAGALLGWTAVQMLASWWALALYVALMLALNIASEKISFSRVIEKNRVLSWLDGLGRLPASEQDTEYAEKSSREVVTTEK
jgi:UDP-GlcNAc:undecaprenyl-phosphate/decaprenyl-phosphate GlcNAc-1-phosphate transferase